MQDFQKRSNVIKCSKDSSKILARHSAIIANAEGLYSHKDSAILRKNNEEDDE